jgi:hypothetical protein
MSGKEERRYAKFLNQQKGIKNGALLFASRIRSQSRDEVKIQVKRVAT